MKALQGPALSRIAPMAAQAEEQEGSAEVKVSQGEAESSDEGGG